MRHIRLLLLACLLLPPSLAAAQTLTIGTKAAPPFVVENEDGSLSGISIDLWRELAADLGVEYEFQRTDLEGLTQGLQDGSLDASIAALTVTAEREEKMDFSHPYYTTGLAIAVPQHGNRVWAAVKRFFSWEFLTALAALAGLLLFVGFIIWLFERRHNAEEFGGGPAQGLGSGFWWAAVTMTTVGYGDKAPRTPGGRAVGLVWMFAAIIIISSFTAAIATSLTVSHLKTEVRSVRDLPDVRVATVADSSSVLALEARGIHHRSTADLQDALALLAKRRVDAVVYDEPILKYLANQEYPKRTRVLENGFERQDYAIALPQNSPLRERLNRALLEIINSDRWDAILQRYLGETD